MFEWLKDMMFSNAVKKLQQADAKKQPKKSIWQKIEDNKRAVRNGGSK